MIIIFYDRSLLRISRRYVQRCSTRTILCQDQVTKLWQTVYYYHLCGILVTGQIGELPRSETVQTVCQRIKMYCIILGERRRLNITFYRWFFEFVVIIIAFGWFFCTGAIDFKLQRSSDNQINHCAFKIILWYMING